jgi:hypothetical protein
MVIEKTILDIESFATSLAFSADGVKLATGNANGSISIYRTTDYKCM